MLSPEQKLEAFVEHGLGIKEVRVTFNPEAEEVMVRMKVPMAQVSLSLNSLGTLDLKISEVFDAVTLDSKILVGYRQQDPEDCHAIITVITEID